MTNRALRLPEIDGDGPLVPVNKICSSACAIPSSVARIHSSSNSARDSLRPFNASPWAFNVPIATLTICALASNSLNFSTWIAILSGNSIISTFIAAPVVYPFPLASSPFQTLVA
ncbi:hypothetical protein [Burkholderia puraquae]|uniref:hypothetical protein n=1 Tax=Burkholderia puraquae TaxID=1904757 RepID=UPI0013FD54EA|nr:hypothetical protein [Burkholderia puraquae]